MRKHLVVLPVVMCLLACGSQLTAQSTSQPSTEPLQIRVIPYLWATSVDGPVGVADLTANVDASFRNILDHLHFALMGFADATWNNKIVVMSDVLYTDIRGHRATPDSLFSSVTPNQKLFLLTPAGGYRMFDNGRASLDAVGGIRYWHLKSELDFQPGLLAGRNVEDSRGWVDGIAGVRGTAYLPRRWWVTGYADAGGGGSNFTYQILGIGGVDIHKHYAIAFGYRYLNVDYNKDHFLYDTAMKGPLFGFAFKF